MKKAGSLLVVIMGLCAQAFALSAETFVSPTLDFDKTQYYEFGFSKSPVAGGDPQLVGSVDFVPEITVTADGATVSLDAKDFWVYWNVISNTDVSIYIKASPLTLDGEETTDPKKIVHWSIKNLDETGDPTILSSDNSYGAGTERVKIIDVGTTSTAVADDRHLQMTIDSVQDLLNKYSGTYKATITMEIDG